MTGRRALQPAALSLPYKKTSSFSKPRWDSFVQIDFGIDCSELENRALAAGYPSAREAYAHGYEFHDPFEVSGEDYPAKSTCAESLGRQSNAQAKNEAGLAALYQVIRGLIRLDQLNVYDLGPLKPIGGGLKDSYTIENFIKVMKAKHGASSPAAASLAEDMRALLSASWRIRGNSYRAKEAQSALRNKNRGNRVLVIREPKNANDPNALAVLVAQAKAGIGCASSEYNWVHVGYAPKEIAAWAVDHWPSYEGRFLIAEGQLTASPAYTAEPAFRLTGWRWY